MDFEKNPKCAKNNGATSNLITQVCSSATPATALILILISCTLANDKKHVCLSFFCREAIVEMARVLVIPLAVTRTSSRAGGFIGLRRRGRRREDTLGIGRGLNVFLRPRRSESQRFRANRLPHRKATSHDETRLHTIHAAFPCLLIN